MKYKYCLNEKTSEISTNCYKCTTVVPEDFQIQMQYQLVLDTSDYPKIDNNVFGCPDNWVFEFSDVTNFNVRPICDAERLEQLKKSALDKVIELYRMCITKGSPTCYVETSVQAESGNSILLDCSQEDLINMQGLLKLMTDFEQHEANVTDYFNEIHLLSFENINKMVNEMLLNGAYLHTKKGILRAQVNSAKSIEELEQINISFKEHQNNK